MPRLSVLLGQPTDIHNTPVNTCAIFAFNLHRYDPDTISVHLNALILNASLKKKKHREFSTVTIWMTMFNPNHNH